MKILLTILLSFGFLGVFAQQFDNKSETESKSIFDCKSYERKFLIMSNSGVRYTPYGLKIGFACKTGFYIGFRHGKGEMYHSDSSRDTTKTNLYSVTAGIIKPIVNKNKFTLSYQIGVGYGEWWGFRWERWTNKGYELEGGFILAYDRLAMTVGISMIDGSKTYADYDITLGIGYRF